MVKGSSLARPCGGAGKVTLKPEEALACSSGGPVKKQKKLLHAEATLRQSQLRGGAQSAGIRAPSGTSCRRIRKLVSGFLAPAPEAALRATDHCDLGRGTRCDCKGTLKLQHVCKFFPQDKGSTRMPKAITA